MKNKISASMMCMDIFDANNTVSTMEKLGVEYYHIDIMDGCFVQNFTLGTDFCAALKRRSSIPLDIHLMVEHPEDKLDWFPFGENDMVSVHAETTKHLQKVLTAIRDRGAKAIAALNPATPITAVCEILDDVDALLLMTVNPGFSGQKLIPSTLKKITRLREYLDEKGYENVEIEVDGNVSFENARLMKNAGANIFVAGTSSIFDSSMTLSEGIGKLRKVISDT